MKIVIDETEISSMVLRKFTHIRISILSLTRPDHDRWDGLMIDETKMPLTVFIDFLIMISQKSQISTNQNINLSLESQMKCDDIFSDPDSDHIFSKFSVTYLVYILFLIICGIYPITSKRVRGRDLL